MGDVAGVTGFEDCLHNRRVIEFLGIVDFVSAGDSRGVIMGDVLFVGLEGLNDIAFHNLGVVDVVEDFEAVGADLFADLDAEFHIVEHIVLVVDFGVEIFEAKGNIFLLCSADDFLNAFDGIFDAVFLADTIAVAWETDDVGESVFGSGVDACCELGYTFVVVFGMGETFGEGMREEHRAGKPGVFGGLKFIGFEQVDTLEAHLGAYSAEFIEGNLIEAPSADGLVDSAVFNDLLNFERQGGGNG